MQVDLMICKHLSFHLNCIHTADTEMFVGFFFNLKALLHCGDFLKSRNTQFHENCKCEKPMN